jgi:hypothetical protein
MAIFKEVWSGESFEVGVFLCESEDIQMERLVSRGLEIKLEIQEIQIAIDMVPISNMKPLEEAVLKRA